MKKKILFLCTGNSCRSQMAEAIVNARLGRTWEAFSVGVRPADNVHPKGVKALAEIGIAHAGRTKLVDEFRDVDFDLVLTLCDTAVEECPAWLGKGKHLHHDFPDPAKAVGNEDEVMQVFRTVRDDIEHEMIKLLAQYNKWRQT
jgi:arsenate reductase (thioredoxin)